MDDLLSQIADLSADRRELLERRLRQDGGGLRSPILSRGGPGEAPLSFAQEQLWFLDQLQPGNPWYNIAACVRFRGLLDPVAVEQVLRGLVARHEILRTAVVARDGQPAQVIAPAVALDMPIVNLRTLPASERAVRAQELAAEEARKPFDLSRGPLIRARLLRLGVEEHWLLLTVHHIAADGWSMRVLVRELAQLYDAFATGEETPLAELPLQYADFATWQRRCHESGAFEPQLAWWKDRLAGAPCALDLSTDRPRPATQTANGARHQFVLPAYLGEEVRELARREGHTPFMVLLAAFQAVLHRYSGQDDFCIGTPVAGRGRPELEGLVGDFVNTLALRADLAGDPSFRELLERVRETALAAYAHQDVPFEHLVEVLKPPRDAGRSPIIQVLFALDLEPDPRLKLPGLALEFSEIDTGTAKFDLSLCLRDGAAGLAGYLEYNSDLFDAETAVRLIGHWQTFLDAALADPDRHVGELPLLTEDERRLVLVDWNDTRSPLPRQECLHELVEAQVDRTPEAPALVVGDEVLTYRELNRRANQLAHHLREQGVGPEELVGVCLQRSADMVVALLGILKAGGAYVPLDPAHPTERLAFMLQDAGVRVIVTKHQLAGRVRSSGAWLVCIDSEARAIALADDYNPTGGTRRDNLAYVLYTSGSTGRPKGVAVEHRSTVMFVDWIRLLLRDEDFYGVLAGTPIGFDISVLELFATLSSGGRVILAEDPLELARLPAAADVTLISTVPSAMAALLEMGALPPSVRTVILGGEELPQPLARRIYETGSVERLFNLYGPTETTVYSTWSLVPRDVAAPVSIGRPIANTRVYVLDGRRQPVPIGVPGELYIGGAGLARGYLNREELTAQKFVPDPFGRATGGRMYQSGDRVRWKSTGELEFLGRNDHQLKVRGFRIEAGEIEAVLRRHASVRQAVVVARESSPGDKRLVAYVAVDGDNRPSSQELHRQLRECLPEYMVPSAFVLLDALPLTANGKIDRKALPVPELGDTGPEVDDCPRTPVEEIVAGIWVDVLRVPNVGTRTNFFELGGHSLLATRVVSRLRDAFGVDVPVRALFEAPTVSELAARVETLRNAGQAVADGPIQTVTHQGPLPLSFAQERLWFLDQWRPDSALYNIPVSIRVCGLLDVAALEQSIGQVVRRHEVLRTTFPSQRGQPAQVIASGLSFRLSVSDLSDLNPGERDAEARRIAGEDAQRPFDLARGPLLRAIILRLGPEEHVLILVMHHIVSDGWSLDVFFTELAACYEARLTGRTSPLPEPPIQYADYAAWQRREQGAVLNRQLSYWRERLAGASAALELPTDRPRPAALTYRGAALRFALPAELVARVGEVARLEGCTPFMVFLTAFEALLHRYSGQDDFCVGTPVAGRTRPEMEPLIGLFVTTLALRAELADDPSFRALLRRVRETCLGAYAHQDVPFERLVEELKVARDPGRTPIFQVMFALDHRSDGRINLPGASLRASRIDTGTSKFDLSLHLSESSDGLEGYLEYSTDLFDEATIERLAGHYRALLEGACAAPDSAVSRLPLLTEPERKHLRLWNATEAEYPHEHLLHRLIERQVGRTPDAEAVRCGDHSLSFAELDRRAAALAARLRALGVGPDVPVGVCMHRSCELVVALYGTLKAGGCYVPLDPDYPAERLAFMLRDSGPPVLLTQSRLTGRLPKHAAHTLLLDDGWGADDDGRELPDAGLTPDHLAYIIYTSGSTGQPKGAANTHRAICNRLLWMQDTYRLTAADTVLQKTPYSFDVSVWEFFWSLLSGARLVLARPGGHQDPAYLAELIHDEHVTVCHFVPSMLDAFLREPGLEESCETLRDVVCSGEALSYDLQERFFTRLGSRLHNLYGPTEAAVDVTSWECRRGDERRVVPIGRPITNVRLHVLDKHQQEVPAGVPGELCIGGIGLARGYWKRPELTAENFVEHPVLGRLYRTGDVGRWLLEGALEYLGRADGQVKGRGCRVELGEGEGTLRQYPAVREAAVAARANAPGNICLVAYVVRRDAATHISAESLRGYLRGRLPEYMVPSAFVFIDALPLTPSGKLDRNALPVPDRQSLDRTEAFVAPRTPTEEAVAAVWADVLGKPIVGAHDNFFDLGGHSLLATQVVARLREIFQIEVPVPSLFEHPTVSALSEEVERRRAADDVPHAPPFVPVARSGELPASFAQQRLWFLDQWEPASGLYNIAAAVHLTGPLDTEALERSLREIVRRHEVLRTHFAATEGRPVPVITEESSLPLPVIDLSDLPAGEREPEARRLAGEEARRPFHLAAGPLLRVTLLRLAPDEHVALVVLHHIVSDGWSVGVLNRELGALYEAYAAGRPSRLPDLPLQYADYAVWQRQWLQGDVLDKQLAYWKERLADIAPLDVPADRPRPSALTYRGASLRFDLPVGLAEQVRGLARREGCTPFMVLLAAFEALLHRYTGQDDFCVGTPVAGRRRAETEGLIGFFVNTLALRGDLSGDPSFRGLLGRVRESCLGAYAHQDVPFEHLVEELKPERDLSRSPLFQVMFVLQNAPQDALKLPGVTVTPWDVETGTSKFDVTLRLTDRDGELHGEIEYSTDLFEEATAERLAAHYQALLHGACADPATAVSQLPLLTKPEREQLSRWNATRVNYPQDELLHDLIERQVGRTPDGEAVRCGDHSLSFAELDRRAAVLAARLRALGVGPDVPVGVCMHRSCELVVALYGTLKAGGCYVPLDPDYPTERLAFMLGDSGPPVLLTQSRLADRLPEHAAHTLLLDDDWGADAEGSEELPDAGLTPDHLAYIIYTSGSTGQPKGAANIHRAICNRLLWMQDTYRLTEADTVLQKTPYSFDVSVWEFFWPLLSGARLVLARPGGHQDPAYLAELIHDEHVTVCHFVPSMLDAFLREPRLEATCGSLRDVVCSGEALSYDLQERFFARLSSRLHNLYGPTEAAVDVTSWECRRGDERRIVPIGRPIANIHMRILDRCGQEVPVGVPGELYIGGVGLARGYWKRPELTADKFVKHPAFGRLYRTGDLGRWLNDGVIEYLGRTDHQVKVRGCRVELGEIEAALREHPAVRDAAALARAESPGDTRLVAYVVPREAAGHISTEALREHLRARLPEYMVPSAVVVLDALPLTPSGKLDRNALPTPNTARSLTDDTYVAPRNEVEEAVARIWIDVLGVERVGAHDNFFDLGGHSLLATQVLSRIRQTFPVDISVRRLFQEPTVATLALAVAESQAASTNGTIVKVSAEEDEILSRLDDMSDDEVESLLDGALAEEEVS